MQRNMAKNDIKPFLGNCIYRVFRIPLLHPFLFHVFKLHYNN